MTSRPDGPSPARWRLPLAGLVALAAVGIAGVGPAGVTHRAAAADPVYAGPIADAPCDDQSLPESQQGRVSAADVADGRAAKGYTCNTAQVGHVGATGGFRVERYVDAAGHECAYFDSTLLFPKDATSPEGPGTYVMDMTDHAHPVHVDTLTTPAMLSPHESLRLNATRGLLVADMGYPTFNPGFVDVYDVTADCRHPVLRSSSPLGVLGHESGFAPDGMTFYVAANSGHTLTALDLSNPALPVILWVSAAYIPHGVSISDDGTRMYLADDFFNGLIILDTSQIQARVPNPQVPEISRLTWPEASIPQIAIPITVHGHPYVVEDDEYTSGTLNPTVAVPMVGAARIIDAADEKHPVVVSNIRLAVHQTANRATDQSTDPGASGGAQGYAAHYCSVSTRVDPTIMACSMIVSGLRVFDIRDPLHPTEIGYFNGPVRPGTPGLKEGAFAMSSPAYDLAHHEIWYSDGNTGFYTVRLTSAAADIAGTGSTAAIPVPAVTAPTQAAAPQSAPQSAPQAAPATAARRLVVATRVRTTRTHGVRRVAGASARAAAPARLAQPTRTLAFTGGAPLLTLGGVLAVVTGAGLARRPRARRRQAAP